MKANRSWILTAVILGTLAPLRAALAETDGQMLWPVSGAESQMAVPGGHRGNDIQTHGVIGLSVIAPFEGDVVDVGTDWPSNYYTPSCSPGGRGRYVTLQHSGGWLTTYFHLNEQNVAVGQHVSQGDLIAHAGNTGCSTGAHLHFEIHQNGAVNYAWDDAMSLNQAVSQGDPIPYVFAGLVGSAPPPPDTSHDPYGAFDLAQPLAANAVQLSGWAIDPDAPASGIEIHAYAFDASGAAVAQTSLLQALLTRADVGNAYPGTGQNHGFQRIFAGIPASATAVCTYAINVGPGNNVALGCKPVAMVARDPASPFGALDFVTAPLAGRVQLRGWAIDDSAPAQSIDVHVYMDGVPGLGGTGIAIAKANTWRADVGAAYPGRGNTHGFDIAIDRVPPGPHEICAYAINVGSGSQNPLIGCGVLDAGVSNPSGSLDAVTGIPGNAIEVSGWAIDTDAPTTGVDVHVYVRDPAGNVVTSTNLSAASQSRPDVAAAYLGVGAAHGYDRIIGGVPAGNFTVCTYAINIGAGTVNTQLGCAPVTVVDRDPDSPFGTLDVVTAMGGGKIHVGGWAADRSAPLQSISADIYIDGRPGVGTGVQRLTANGARPDVARAYPGYGAQHGFDAVLSLSPGRHDVCAWGINVGPGAQNPVLGCKVVDVQ